MLVFQCKRGSKTAQKVKNYGSSKILRIRAPYYFEVRKGPLGWQPPKHTRKRNTLESARNWPFQESAISGVLPFRCVLVPS